MDINIKDIPKSNLCYKLNHKSKFGIKEIGHGLSASIYKYKNNVIKEVYLNNDIVKSRKINELYVNYIISKNNELKQYVIPFYSYDLCTNEDKPTLLMEFKFVGKSLEEQLYKITPIQLSYVIIEVERIIKLFNYKGITHNDLHPGNIYYNPINNKILIGDWGLSVINSKLKDDLYVRFYPELYKRTLFSYYINSNKKDYKDKAIKYLKSKGLYKDLINEVEREKKYYFKKFTYKPKSFVNKITKDIYDRLLRNYLTKDEKFLIENSNISPEILEILALF